MKRFRTLSLVLSLFAVVLAAAGCENPFSSDREVTMYVASYQVDCVGVGPMKCLLTRERPEDDWQYFYDSIAGFQWEPGYLYKLRVSLRDIENPPADGSSIEYRLVELLEKTAAPVP